VYFFSCSCGSRVFFDLPHPPWPPHEDRCIPYLIRYLRDVERMSAGAVRQLVDEYALRRGLEVPRAIRKQLVVAENRETGRSTVIPILPAGNSLTALGTVASVDRVNFLKRFTPRGSLVGRALIGRLADEAHVEVRIRGDRDPATGFIDEFTFFLRLKTWQASGLRQGALVVVDLRGHTLPTGQHVWFAESVQRARTRG